MASTETPEFKSTDTGNCWEEYSERDSGYGDPDASDPQKSSKPWIHMQFVVNTWILLCHDWKSHEIHLSYHHLVNP